MLVAVLLLSGMNKCACEDLSPATQTHTHTHTDRQTDTHTHTHTAGFERIGSNFGRSPIVGKMLSAMCTTEKS